MYHDWSNAIYPAGAVSEQYDGIHLPPGAQVVPAPLHLQQKDKRISSD